MALAATTLADTSAMARLARAPVIAALSPLLDAGLVATTPVVEFELLWSSRSRTDFRLERRVHEGRELLLVEPVDWERALQVQEQLWGSGRRRAVGLADLLTAAVAERHRVTLLHYDSDFDLVHDITGQPMLWVVPRGTVA